MVHTPPIFVLSGSFSVGKSTLLQALSQQYGETVRIIPEGSRISIENLAPDGIQHASPETRRAIQLAVIDYHKSAEHPTLSLEDPRPVISDTSLVEVMAYSKDFFTTEDFSDLETLVKSRASSYVLLRIPCGIFDITQDGIRHEDMDFQREIDDRIEETIRSMGCFQVAHMPKTCIELEDRLRFATEVLSEYGVVPRIPAYAATSCRI